MDPCTNLKCPHYDASYLNSCRSGDLFCLLVQETNRVKGQKEDYEDNVYLRDRSGRTKAVGQEASV